MLGLLFLTFCAVPFLVKLMFGTWRARSFAFFALSALFLTGALLLLWPFLAWELWLTLAAVTLWVSLKPTRRDLVTGGVFGKGESMFQPPRLRKES